MEQADMQFFENLFRSLEVEMRQGFASLDSRMTAMDARMAHMSDRMDRIGGLVNGGSRVLTRLAEWSERSDVTTADTLRRVADFNEWTAKANADYTRVLEELAELKQRIAKLEGKEAA